MHVWQQVFFGMIVWACLSRGEDIALKCDDFERMYDSLASELYCTVSGFTVSHSQNVKLPKYPKANMTKFMKFYDSRLLYIPFKLFDVFTNLLTLDVSNTEILEVPRYTFGAANGLTYLNMSNNNLTQITTSVFLGANNLMRLDLSRNRITIVDTVSFRGLGKLDKLQLSFNQLAQLPKDIFIENVYVEVISLDNNLLEYIEPEVFSRLRRIRDVNLSNNRLVRVHANSFQDAVGLESLLLSSNRLSEFQLANKSISSLLSLDGNNLTSFSINGTKFVYANHNRIQRLELINPTFLESLELKWNNVSDISNITSLSGLLYLDLSENPIGLLNVTTFDRLKRLRYLILRGTGMRRLSFGMFSKQTNLDRLDLSFNNLTELNLDIFVPYLINLKQFYVDGNNLTEVSGKLAFSFAFPSLFELGVSRNRFNCSYLHTLLVPPQLSANVQLHIEPDDSDAEMSHIRDVSCVSSVRQSLQTAELELHDMTQVQRMMKQSMEALRLHEQRLEVYLLLMKIALLVVICLVLVALAARLVKLKRTTAYFSTRRGASIVFQSSGTVNSNIEH